MENLNIVIDKGKEEIYLIERKDDLIKGDKYNFREAKKNILDDKIYFKDNDDNIKDNFDTYKVIEIFSFKNINYYFDNIKNPYGIKNIGNTCFFNGITQLIINNKLLITNLSRILFYKLGRDKLPDKTYFDIGVKNPDVNIYNKIIYLFLSLVIKKKRLNLNNIDYKKFFLNDKNPEIKYLNKIINDIQTNMGGGQQDADEVFRYFINNMLSIRIGDPLSGGNYNDYLEYIKTIINNINKLSSSSINIRISTPSFLTEDIYNLTLPQINNKTLQLSNNLKYIGDDKPFFDSLENDKKIFERKLNNDETSVIKLKAFDVEMNPPEEYLKLGIKLVNENFCETLILLNDKTMEYNKSYYECFFKIFNDDNIYKKKNGKTMEYYWEGTKNNIYPIIFNDILLINLMRENPLGQSIYSSLSLDKSTASNQNQDPFIRKNENYYYIDINDLIDMLKIPEQTVAQYELIDNMITLLKKKYKDKKYKIYSLIIKSGGVGGGHYYSYNYVNDKYWMCNDDIISPLSLDNIGDVLINSTLSQYVRSMCLEMID